MREGDESRMLILTLAISSPLLERNHVYSPLNPLFYHLLSSSLLLSSSSPHSHRGEHMVIRTREQNRCLGMPWSRIIAEGTPHKKGPKLLSSCREVNKRNIDKRGNQRGSGSIIEESYALKSDQSRVTKDGKKLVLVLCGVVLCCVVLCGVVWWWLWEVKRDAEEDRKGGRKGMEEGRKRE